MGRTGSVTTAQPAQGSRSPGSPQHRGPGQGHDPAVLAWRLVLAPRPRHRAGRHWWREYVTETFRNAQAHREQLRESGRDVGSSLAGGHGTVVPAHQLEQDQFDELYPAPRLKDFLVGLSQGRHDPYVTWEAAQH